MTKEEYLTYVDSAVINWLKFAEAKNAALIVLIISTLSFITGIESISLNIKYVLFFIFMISLIISCFSFMPIYSFKDRTKRNLDFHSFNPFFYKSLSCLELKDYEDYLSEKFSESPNDDMDRMIMKEIIDNSKITVRKYKFFSAALTLYILAILIFLVLMFWGGKNIELIMKCVTVLFK